QRSAFSSGLSLAGGLTLFTDAGLTTTPNTDRRPDDQTEHGEERQIDQHGLDAVQAEMVLDPVVDVPEQPVGWPEQAKHQANEQRSLPPAAELQCSTDPDTQDGHDHSQHREPLLYHGQINQLAHRQFTTETQRHRGTAVRIRAQGIQASPSSSVSS